MNSTKILEPKLENRALSLSWADGVSTKFSFRWLKDHSHDKESLDSKTNQRLVDTAKINADEKPASCDLKLQEGNLVLTWANSKCSVLPIEFLYDCARGIVNGGSESPEGGIKLWYQDEIKNEMPISSYSKIETEADESKDWLEKLWKYGFALVNDTPVSLEATEKLINKIGYVRHTIYGGMWEFSANLEHEDTAYTASEIGLHTDGTYNFDPAGLQILHCLEFDGTGGENILVDGFRVAQDLRNECSEAFEVLSTVKVPGHYLGAKVHLKANHEVIKLSSSGNIEQICYNNFDRAPFALPVEKMEKFYEALGEFARRLAMDKYRLKFTLEPGIPLFFDNWRVLHARNAYTGKRVLCGGYINREDYLSKLRILGVIDC